MSEPITVFASFRPLPSAHDDFRELMAGMIVSSRREQGCELYDFYADGDGGYHLLERYRDQAALEAHRASDHYRDYRARVADMLEGDVDVLLLTEIDRG